MTTKTTTTTAISKGSDLTLITIDPKDIMIDDVVNVRPFTSKVKGDDKDIAQLAESIRIEGQITPVEVRYDTGNGTFHLIAGHRRVRAIALLNKTAKEPIEVQAVVKMDEDVSDDTALRHAIMENVQRENMSPMDIAMMITTIRERFGWAGSSGSKKVASYMGVSPATITTHESLLGLDESLQARIHSGELKADAALIIAKVAPEKREEVIETAKASQAVEEASGKGKKTTSVKAKHIAKAAREVAGATKDEDKKPLTRGELLDFFEDMQGPAYGYEDGDVRKFATYFTTKFAKGIGTATHANKLFAICVEKAHKGTKPVIVKEAVKPASATKKVVTATKGKTVTRPSNSGPIAKQAMAAASTTKKSSTS